MPECGLLLPFVFQPGVQKPSLALLKTTCQIRRPEAFEGRRWQTHEPRQHRQVGREAAVQPLHREEGDIRSALGRRHRDHLGRAQKFLRVELKRGRLLNHHRMTSFRLLSCTWDDRTRQRYRVDVLLGGASSPSPARHLQPVGADPHPRRGHHQLRPHRPVANRTHRRQRPPREPHRLVIAQPELPRLREQRHVVPRLRRPAPRGRLRGLGRPVTADRRRAGERQRQRLSHYAATSRRCVAGPRLCLETRFCTINRAAAQQLRRCRATAHLRLCFAETRRSLA